MTRNPRPIHPAQEEPTARCPHCFSGVIACHHQMYRCSDPACARWWHLKEIIAAEDYDAGARTAPPIVRSAHIAGFEECPPCTVCGERGPSCACKRFAEWDGGPRSATFRDEGGGR